MTTQAILTWAAGPLTVLILAIFLRAWPKDKAIAKGEEIGGALGLLLSKAGNTKLGRKVWSKVEEGPIVTVLAFTIALINKLEVKMLEDNSSKE